MMRGLEVSFVKALILILIVLSLQACTSPKMAEELEQGKLSFANGDFKQAFHELLPVAVSGNRQAQYAVGYMYYNGYGTQEDTESGIFWMSKSADQGYQPAQNALRLISEKNLQIARVQHSYKGDMVPSVHPMRKETLRVYPDESIPPAPLSPVPDASSQPHSPPPFLNSPPPSSAPPALKTSLNTRIPKKDEVLQSLVATHLTDKPKIVSKAVISAKPVTIAKVTPIATKNSVVSNKPVIIAKPVTITPKAIAKATPASASVTASKKPVASTKVVATTANTIPASLVMTKLLSAPAANKPMNMTPIAAAKINTVATKAKAKTNVSVIKKKTLVNAKATTRNVSNAKKKPIVSAKAKANKATANSHFTLQVFGSYELAKVKELQLSLPTKRSMHTFKTERNGKPWYVLTYGQFKTATAAKQTLSAMPASLRHLQPWIRPANQLTAVG